MASAAASAAAAAAEEGEGREEARTRRTARLPRPEAAMMAIPPRLPRPRGGGFRRRPRSPRPARAASRAAVPAALAGAGTRRATGWANRGRGGRVAPAAQNGC